MRSLRGIAGGLSIIAALAAMASCGPGGDQHGASAAGGGSDGCPGGLSACGGQCIDLSSDAANCGSCGQVCAQGQPCAGGSCGCPAGATPCGGKCKQLSYDADNCGSCGHVCAVGTPCVGGQCMLNCSGNANCNGTCVDLMTDHQHCGACGVACALNETCSGSKCVCAVGKACSYLCDFENDHCELDDYSAGCFSDAPGAGGGNALKMTFGGATCGGVAPFADRICASPNGVRLSFDIRFDADYPQSKVAGSVSLLEWPPGSPQIINTFGLTFFGPQLQGGFDHYVVEFQANGTRQVYKNTALVETAPYMPPISCVDDVSIYDIAQISLDNIMVEGF
jgi:hypothetical protein